MKRILSVLLTCLLLLPALADAATWTTVTQITSWPGTTAPTDAGLSGKVVSASGPANVDVFLVVPSGTETWTLVCYEGGYWVPLGDIATDSSAYGGTAQARYAAGTACRSFGVYRKSGAVTPTIVKIGVDIQR